LEGNGVDSFALLLKGRQKQRRGQLQVQEQMRGFFALLRTTRVVGSGRRTNNSNGNRYSSCNYYGSGEVAGMIIFLGV
jgi:hypothetical protein